MPVINISLPSNMKAYIDERVSEGGYCTPSDYVRDLIKEDQKRTAGELEEALLLQGLESPGSEWTNDDVNRIKSAVRERMAAKHQSP